MPKKKAKNGKSRNGKGTTPSFAVSLNPSITREWKTVELARILAGYNHGARKDVIVNIMSTLYDLHMSGKSVEELIVMAERFALEFTGTVRQPAPTLPAPMPLPTMPELPSFKEAAPKAGSKKAFLERVDSNGFM